MATRGQFSANARARESSCRRAAGSRSNSWRVAAASRPGAVSALWPVDYQLGLIGFCKSLLRPIAPSRPSSPFSRIGHHASSVTDHSAYLIAWVFVAIGGTKPEHGDRVLLHEVLDSADYFNRTAIDKDELEHGVRDLVAAELIDVDENQFALTDTGRSLSAEVWREYHMWLDTRGLVHAIRKLLTLRLAEHPISIAARRLKSVACVAAAGWSAEQNVFDAEFARYQAEFDAAYDRLSRGTIGTGETRHEPGQD